MENKNQPRRYEESEVFFYSFFVTFVSSWLIFREGENDRFYFRPRANFRAAHS